MVQCEFLVPHASVAHPGIHVKGSKDSAIARATVATVSRRIEKERSLNLGVKMIDQRHASNLAILGYKKK